MTGTNTFTGASGDLQYVLNTIYAPKVEREFRANLLAANLFTDMSSLLTAGGLTISIPDIYTTQFSDSAKSTASEVTLNSPAQAQLTMTVNTWRENSYLIEDLQLAQIDASSDVLEAYAAQSKYIIAKRLDTAILANYSTLSQSANDTANDVADVDIRTAIESVLDGDIPQDELFFLFHPTVIWHDLMGIAKYTNVYQFGALQGERSPILTGMFGGEKLRRAYRGLLYGIPIYETTNIPADSGPSGYFNLLAHPKTFMFATHSLRGAGQIRSQANYVPENLGTLWTTDIAYGTGELRDETACVIKSRSSGVVS